jgi:hypothetical protein
MNSNEIFISVYFIQYLWDRLTTTCITKKGEVLLILHHIMSVYLLIGGFIFNPKYHLLSLIIIMIHWLINKNKCLITDWTNHYCGYDNEKPFQDIITKLKLREYISPNIHWYFIISLIIYDIKKVCKL